MGERPFREMTTAELRQAISGRARVLRELDAKLKACACTPKGQPVRRGAFVVDACSCERYQKFARENAVRIKREVAEAEAELARRTQPRSPRGVPPFRTRAQWEASAALVVRRLLARE